MGYKTEPYPPLKKLLSDAWAAIKTKNVFQGLIEVDITRVREYMKVYKERHGETLSLTAYITYCVAKTLERHKYVNALRTWKGDLIFFDVIDVNVLVERNLNGNLMGIAHIIKDAGRKTFIEIHRDIRKAQTGDTEEVAGGIKKTKWANLLLLLPGFIRRMLWRLLLSNPHFVNSMMGTVSVSAVGMAGKGGGWGIIGTFLTFSIVIGGISEKPVLTNNTVTMHEHLHLTFAFDHAVIDGAPAARFLTDLGRMIEAGMAIEELVK